MQRRNAAAAVVTLTIIAGCDRSAESGAFCARPWTLKEAREQTKPPPPTSGLIVDENATDKRQFARWCIQRTAYLYARSTDPAETVARAVRYSCDSQIKEAAQANFEWLQKTFDKPDSKVAPPSREEEEQRSEQEYSQDALSDVVEARAGNCWTKVKPD